MAPPTLTQQSLKKLWAQYRAARWNQSVLSRQTDLPLQTLRSRLKEARRRLSVIEPAAEAQVGRSTPTALAADKIVETYRAYADSKFDKSKAARSLKLPIGTFRKRLDTAHIKLGLTEEAPAEVEARTQQRLRDRIVQLEREKTQMAREINAEEDLRKAVFKLADQPVKTISLALKSRPPAGSAGVPMLLASDFQWGEVIRIQEMDGVNEFNAVVASRRYKDLIARTLDLCTNHTTNASFDVFYYWRLGDMTSGEIHQELRETNDLGSISAVLDLAAHEIAGIKELLKVYKRVVVPSVPGNHGRTTIKPFAKRFVETNYDYLLACMIEREFKGDPRLEFYTPLSGDVIIQLFGYRYLGTHGDRIGSRGGEGFIGPVATITRGMKKLHDYYARLGQPVDFQFMGHFHTPIENEYGFCNGSLPGYSEYAKQFRMSPQPPAQWLLFAHPKYGISARWKILLEPKPRIPQAAVKAFEKAA